MSMVCTPSCLYNTGDTANVVIGKWYRWFHSPRGQSSSPDTPTTRQTILQTLSRSTSFKWDTVPFPTPLHVNLDYVYTIDEVAGHFTVTQWKGVDGTLYPRVRRATLASIRETLLDTIDTLLEDVEEASMCENYSSDSSCANKCSVQHLLGLFGTKPNTPARLNELQFQLFTDFIFIWRFYFDNISNWEPSSYLFATLAMGIFRIAAWDFEVLNTYSEQMPILFSSYPQWKSPSEEAFWFHRYLILFCSPDQMGTAVATKAKHFLSQSNTSSTGYRLYDTFQWCIFWSRVRIR